MQAQDYYGSTNERSSDWKALSSEPGYSPVADLMHAAMPKLGVGKRALDIGCQGGHQIALLTNFYEELIGVDIADYSEMWRDFPSVIFKIHDIDSEQLPYPENHFDLVLATNVLEHVFDVFGFLDEAHRVLRPGGILLISVPNISHFRRIWDLIQGRVPRTGARERPFLRESGWDGQHLHYFTPKELQFLLEECGFEIVEYLNYGRLPFIKRLSPQFLSSSIDVVCRSEKY